jgi:hypothetical protein
LRSRGYWGACNERELLAMELRLEFFTFGIICRIITIGIISIITIGSNIIPGGNLNKRVLLFRGIIFV